MKWYDALFYAYLGAVVAMPLVMLAVHVWRGLEPGKRAEIKRAAPAAIGRGILGALKWVIVAVIVFGVELVRFALKENPDPHNRKL